MITIDKKNARTWSIMGINPSVWSVGFNEIAKEKKNVAVLTADLSRFSGLERIARSYPDIFYNVGIAEQNMVGIAAGMAMEGIQTFITSYAPFVTFRCADQIRHLMGNMKLNIKAIGSGAGLSSGWSGSALLAVNDIAFMRSIPNMTVVSPADCAEAVKMMAAISETDTPVYMRTCGGTRIPMVYTEEYPFEIGKAVRLQEGEEVAIIATGVDMVSSSLGAAGMIEEKFGKKITVINMHTIKPLDVDCIRELTKQHKLIVTVEEHSVIGGLGSAVAEELTKMNCNVQHEYCGIQDAVMPMGSRSFMLSGQGLTAEGIAEKIALAGGWKR